MSVKKKTTKKAVSRSHTILTEDAPAPKGPDDQHTPAVMIGTPPPGAMVFETAEGEPNISIRVFTPLMAIMTRAFKVFFTTIVASVGVTASGYIPGATWKEGLAIAGSAMLLSIAQNAVSIFSDLEKKYPLLGA